MLLKCVYVFCMRVLAFALMHVPLCVCVGMCVCLYVLVKCKVSFCKVCEFVQACMYGFSLHA